MTFLSVVGLGLTSCYIVQGVLSFYILETWYRDFIDGIGWVSYLVQMEYSMHT